MVTRKSQRAHILGTVKDPEEQMNLWNRDGIELEKTTGTPQKASTQVALDAKGKLLH